MIQLVRPSRGHITQFYGARQVDGNPHAGQDYAYTNGGEIFPEVYAAADGVVLFAGDSRGLSWPNIMYLNPDFNRADNVDESAGNYTIIAHYVNGVQVALTGYGHQEQVWVKAGDTVRAGQRIGTVGETGFSAGKHLHFDLVITPFRVNIAPYYGRVDPNPYFAGGVSPQSGTTTPIQEDDMPGPHDKVFTDGDGKPASLQDFLTDIATGVHQSRDRIAQVPTAFGKDLRDGKGNPASLNDYMVDIATASHAGRDGVAGLPAAVAAAVGQVGAKDIASALSEDLAAELAAELGKRLAGN